MRTQIQALLESITEELAAGKKDLDELEAKAIFCLLNYCPPENAIAQIEEKLVQKL